MIIALLGASGSGKSTIEKHLSDFYGYEKIVSYTTRKPRKGEVNGRDYYFVNNDTFKEGLESDLFAEYDEYSQSRFYGTYKKDYKNGNKIVVLTPNGLRQIRENISNEDIFSVLVNANLGTRMKRYIDRCGVNKFNFDDKNEISSRVDRDFGMFLGVENEVDCIVDNNEGSNIHNITESIIMKMKEVKKRGVEQFT